MNTKLKFFLFLFTASTSITLYSANPGPGQITLYGEGITRSDKDLIEIYIIGLKTLAEENDSEKNERYQHDIKCANSYAKRYIIMASVDQLLLRVRFLAQYMLPPCLGTPQRTSRLFTDRDINTWSTERKDNNKESSL